MTNVYSLDGILVFGLLFVCTCAYFKKVPRLKTWLLSEKKGVWGVFYKGKIISAQDRRFPSLPEEVQSGGWGRCDWNQTACCCGNRLCCNGLLCPVHKMSFRIFISSTSGQGDKREEPVGSWGLAQKS
ncbi:protein kish-B isoform X2 [Suncus etruscus]|uniref:protein kish-B isoform X2 n=1 Tax=Suncus etruscus TaxID=109475 RepID=UPI0021101DD2|nr:protein kish-B isoform X2 [Suncus etruscus]